MLQVRHQWLNIGPYLSPATLSNDSHVGYMSLRRSYVCCGEAGWLMPLYRCCCIGAASAVFPQFSLH